MVCPEEMPLCVPIIDGFAAHYGAETEHIVVARRYLGTFDPPVRYQIVIIPPHAERYTATPRIEPMNFRTGQAITFAVYRSQERS